MQWKINSNTPIYIQLSEHLKRRIIVGGFPPGGRLPSVRELAQEAGVNPNTMQRALAGLEQDGLVYSQRTAGRFVTEDETVIAATKHTLAEALVRQFRRQMESIGYDDDAILTLVQQIKEEETKHGNH